MNPILAEASRRMDEAAAAFQAACESHSAGKYDSAAALYTVVNQKLRKASDLYAQGSQSAEWTPEEIMDPEG